MTHHIQMPQARVIRPHASSQSICARPHASRNGVPCNATESVRDTRNRLRNETKRVRNIPTVRARKGCGCERKSRRGPKKRKENHLSEERTKKQRNKGREGSAAHHPPSAATSTSTRSSTQRSQPQKSFVFAETIKNSVACDEASRRLAEAGRERQVVFQREKRVCVWAESRDPQSGGDGILPIQGTPAAAAEAVREIPADRGAPVRDSSRDSSRDSRSPELGPRGLGGGGPGLTRCG
jgi:hypothetical protein